MSVGESSKFLELAFPTSAERWLLMVTPLKVGRISRVLTPFPRRFGVCLCIPLTACLSSSEGSARELALTAVDSRPHVGEIRAPTSSALDFSRGRSHADISQPACARFYVNDYVLKVRGAFEKYFSVNAASPMPRRMMEVSGCLRIPFRIRMRSST